MDKVEAGPVANLRQGNPFQHHLRTRQGGWSTGILLTARNKTQGPNYLQLGLSLSSNFDGGSESNLRAALLISPLSQLGAEGRVSAAIGSEPELKFEYFRPLDAKSTNLIFTNAGYNNPNINVYDAAGNNTSVYDVGIYFVEARLAHEFDNNGILSFGVQRAAGNGEVQVGDPSLPGFDFDQGTASVSLSIDEADSLYFPRNGYYASLGVLHFTGMAWK